MSGLHMATGDRPTDESQFEPGSFLISSPGTPLRPRGRDWVAIVLAGGMATAMVLVTFAVLWDALHSQGPGLSDNATQVLTTGFAGMAGLLGGYLARGIRTSDGP